MSNPNKIKGSTFERDLVEILNKSVIDSNWKRIPGSGAIGTFLAEPILTSDVVGIVDALPKKFKVECKVGYGGATQFALKKEWLDKVKMEAEATYSIPVLAGKFSGARGDGTKVFIVMDVQIFADLLNHITNLQEQIDARKDDTGSDKGTD